MARWLSYHEQAGTPMMELKPTDSRKSCYGKAVVTLNKDGSRTLYSYRRGIMSIYPDGSMKAHWQGWSATTGRHIKYFSGLSKKEFDALPYTD